MKSLYGPNSNMQEDAFFVEKRPKVHVLWYYPSLSFCCCCCCLTEKDSFQDAYKKWVSFLLNRVNTVNKRQYKSDPTILAWDLLNEPATVAGFDSYRKLAPGTTLKNWVEEMLVFVKQQLKPKQLVFVGDVRGQCSERTFECFFFFVFPDSIHQTQIGDRSDGQPGRPLSYVDTGYNGANAKAYVCSGRERYGGAIPTYTSCDLHMPYRADAATMHYYSEVMGVVPNNATWFFSYFVGDRCRMARECARACIVEELGAALGVFSDRNVVLQRYVDYAWYHGAQIVLLWQVGWVLWNTTMTQRSTSGVAKECVPATRCDVGLYIC